MQIINYGTIRLNKKLTVEALKIFCKFFDTKYFYYPEDCIILIDEFYDNYIGDTFSKICNKLKDFGYVLNGQIDYWGDYSGTIIIINNVVKLYEKETLLDAETKDLIDELKRRGYSVFKNCPNCGRFVQIEKDKILEDDLGYHVICPDCNSSFDL